MDPQITATRTLLPCYSMILEYNETVLPDGLLPLRLPDLGLLVSLGQDVGERGAHHGALELLRLLRALLSSLLLDALAVLPVVEKGTMDL